MNTYIKILYILFIACFISGISSCTIEPNTNSSTTKEQEQAQYVETDLSLILTKAGGTDDTNILCDAETAIQTVRVYAFDGNTLDTMIVKNFRNLKDTCYLSIKLKESTNKNFYVIVNEPFLNYFDINNGYVLPDNIKDTNNFKHLAYAVLGYKTTVINDNPVTDINYTLPAFGAKRNVAINHQKKDKIAIEVQRSVARVDIIFEKDATFTQRVAFSSISSIRVNTSRNAGYIAPYNENVSNDIYSIDKYTNTFKIVERNYKMINDQKGSANEVVIPKEGGSGARLLSLYVPESIHTVPEDSIKITINNLIFGYSSFKKSFEIKIDDLLLKDGKTITPKLKRNTVYKIICKITNVYSPTLDISYVLDEWDISRINKHIIF